MLVAASSSPRTGREKLFMPRASRSPLFRCQQVARSSYVIRMQLNLAELKFAQHLLDTRFNRSVVCAVAGDKLFHNGPQCCGRQLHGECALNQYTPEHGIHHPVASAEQPAKTSLMAARSSKGWPRHHFLVTQGNRMRAHVTGALVGCCVLYTDRTMYVGRMAAEDRPESARGGL